MKLNLSFLVLIGISLITSISGFTFEKSAHFIQQQSYGMYYIPDIPGWNLVAGNNSGDSFVFENAQSSIQVSINKEPLLCETKQEFNKIVLQIIQGYYKQQQFMEQRKQAVQYPCLGVDYCHMLIIKSRETGKRKFILNPLVDDKMFQIEISGEQNNSAPPPEALNFISQISLEPLGEVLASAVQQPTQNQPTANQQKSESINQQNRGQENKTDLSSFKKDKSVAPPTITTNTAITKAKEDISTTGNKSANKPSQNNSPNTPKASDFELKDVKVLKANIDKGTMAEVKFSSIEPCSPSNPKEDGLPWEASQDSKIKLPDDVDVVIPPAIDGLNKLSDQTYNSAVSSAFEAMNLIYGEMPENEAKAFQDAWAPLFDFPSQEIIDYLNKLNPIVSQFLVCREAYARNMAAIQMVLLDAATAIEFDEQEIWESAMAEASLYSTSLPPLETAMKQLIKRLEAIGNPPNPMAAKCEARRRYQKMIGSKKEPDVIFELEGEWVGYTESDLYNKWEKRQPLHILFYSMPMENAFSKESMNHLEGYILRPDGFPWSPEWAKIKIRSWDAPISIFNWTEQMRDNIYDDRIDITYETSIQKSNGTVTGNIRMVLERVGEELPLVAEGLNQARINELKRTKERLAENADPNDVELGMELSNIELVVERLEYYSNRRALFHVAAQLWIQSPPLEINASMDDGKRIEEFTRRMQQIILNIIPENSNQQEIKEPDTFNQEEIANAAKEEESRKEAIKFHNEMIGIVHHTLDRELEERKGVIEKFLNSKTKEEADEHDRRLKDLNFRIIGLQSNIQSEMDLVASYKTGQLVHTRTAFDNYAQHKFVNGIRKEVANIEATRRIVERVERQIKLLPKEVQDKAREVAKQTLDGKTIASGDIEKAKKLVNSFGKQIEGYAGYDYAMAKEEEAYAEIKEQAAQAGIMVVGIGAVGFGSAALVEAYGAEAAAAIYGPKILGAIYGGTTGLIRGGPKEGMSQALMGYSPNGYALSQFVDGFQNAGTKKDATWKSQAWEGAKQAGYAWCVGKVFELGVTGVTKGLLAWRGADSRLFKPVFQSSAQKSRQLQDVLRSKQQQLDAEDIVQTFEKMEKELVRLKLDEVGNSIKIGQMEDELQQLTASMNASYHAKWQFKYKASPRTMRAFDRRVQTNYANMEPGMIQRMEAMGYKMDRMRFKQFRNAGSGGSSSMDLDLVPVQVGRVGKPRTTFMKKDGTIVSAKEFMDDCQAAMNAEYKQLTGISAPASDMNLVTSAHNEAFATAKLLDKSIDMSQFTDEEIKSIGEVLRVKTTGIDKNKMLTNTTKMQSKVRETAKEIENMMLRKLRSDLNKVPSGSAQAREIQSKISYWEKMLERFKQIGMQNSDPSTLIELSNKVRRETGGKDVHAVMDDVVRFFGAN
jgi:hypothetical protein